MLILAVLVVVLAAVLAPVLTGYLTQRADIAAAQQEIESEKQKIEELDDQIAVWQDDDYVEQQARERLRFVKEGETAFTVIDDSDEQTTANLPGVAAVDSDVAEDSPWYGTVWESVKVANEGLPETKEQ